MMYYSYRKYTVSSRRDVQLGGPVLACAGGVKANKSIVLCSSESQEIHGWMDRWIKLSKGFKELYRTVQHNCIAKLLNPDCLFALFQVITEIVS